MSRVNGVLVKPGSYQSLEELMELMEDFNLDSCAIPLNEAAEKAEIRRRLGWPDAVELGKFYDDKGTDSWYFYVYADPRERGPGVTANMWSLGRHMLCTISGPSGDDFPILFTKKDLAEAIWQFRNADPQTVFLTRERSRFERKFLGHSMGPHATCVNVLIDPLTGRRWQPPL